MGPHNAFNVGPHTQANSDRFEPSAHKFGGTCGRTVKLGQVRSGGGSLLSNGTTNPMSIHNFGHNFKLSRLILVYAGFKNRILPHACRWLDVPPQKFWVPMGEAIAMKWSSYIYVYQNIVEDTGNTQ